MRLKAYGSRDLLDLVSGVVIVIDTVVVFASRPSSSAGMYVWGVRCAYTQLLRHCTCAICWFWPKFRKNIPGKQNYTGRYFRGRLRHLESSSRTDFIPRVFLSAYNSKLDAERYRLPQAMQPPIYNVCLKPLLLILTIRTAPPFHHHIRTIR